MLSRWRVRKKHLRQCGRRTLSSRKPYLDHFFDVLDALELDLVLLQLLDHALQPLVELLQLAVI